MITVRKLKNAWDVLRGKRCMIPDINISSFPKSPSEMTFEQFHGQYGVKPTLYTSPGLYEMIENLPDGKEKFFSRFHTDITVTESPFLPYPETNEGKRTGKDVVGIYLGHGGFKMFIK